MAESTISDATANALSGTTDTSTGAVYNTIGESPYYTTDYRLANTILRLLGPTVAELQPYVDDGANHRIGVRAGKLAQGDGTVGTYAGGTLDLSNGNTNYVYLYNASGTWTLAASTNAYPTGLEYMRIATVDLSDSPTTLDHSHITDDRGDLAWTPHRTYPGTESIVTHNGDVCVYDGNIVLS